MDKLKLEEINENDDLLVYANNNDYDLTTYDNGEIELTKNLNEIFKKNDIEIRFYHPYFKDNHSDKISRITYILKQFNIIFLVDSIIVKDNDCKYSQYLDFNTIRQDRK